MAAVDEADVRMLDKTLRRQASSSIGILEEGIAKMDRRIDEFDAEIAKKKYQQEYENKRKELAGQLRSVANKVCA